METFFFFFLGGGGGGVQNIVPWSSALSAFRIMDFKTFNRRQNLRTVQVKGINRRQIKMTKGNVGSHPWSLA